MITAEDSAEGICYLLKRGTVAISSSVDTAEDLKAVAFPNKTEVQDGVLLAGNGCFLGDHVLKGIEGQEVWHRDTARSEADQDQIISRVTMVAKGYVR